MNAIHGHQVLEMMLSSKHKYTRPELIEAIQQRFGADARFFTCSAEGMSAAELVEFLQARGKFAGPESGFQADPDRICQD